MAYLSVQDHALEKANLETAFKAAHSPHPTIHLQEQCLLYFILPVFTILSVTVSNNFTLRNQLFIFDALTHPETPKIIIKHIWQS